VSPAPDTQITIVTSPAATSAPTDTDAWFVAGFAASGAFNTPTLVQSISDFTTTFGAAVNYGPLWDSLDVYFRLGGARAYVSRVGGPAATGTGASDDHTNATDTQWQSAVDAFPKSLGPGQVSMPGRTTDTAHINLLAHAQAKNRFALLDAADTPTVATLTASATAAAAPGNGKYGSLWAPWAVVRGTTPASTRTVPYSCVQAALLAANDSAGVPRSQAAAGKDYGIPGDYVTGLSQPAWVLADRGTLEDGGVSIARIVDNQVASWANRTVDLSTDPRYQQASGMRVLMAMVAEFDVIGVRYEHKRIDGRRHLISQFGSDLSAACKRHYDSDDLFGDTPSQAYVVDVGPTINTLTTIQAQTLKAAVGLKVSETADVIQINILQHLLVEAL
jgi:hypothetical protein